MRLIIEKLGGDGKAVKRELETSYTKVRVWWKEQKVAEWDEETGAMKLMVAMEGWMDEFQSLMGEK